MKRNAMTRSFRNRRGLAIVYQLWRPEDLPIRANIVLVHGLGEHGGRYHHVVDRLVPEGYAIYALDHQGFGRSDGHRGHVERFDDYAEDVHKLVTMARNSEPDLPVIVYGHSMGGLIAILYAQQHQESIDLLVITSPGLKADASPALVLLMRLMNQIRPTFTIRRPGSGTRVSRDPEVVRAFIEDPLFVPVSSARWAVEILAAQPRAMANASEIRLPVLVMQGEADVVVDPQATYRFFELLASEDKTLLTYPKHFHELHNDIDKEKPLGDLLAWLNEKTEAIEGLRPEPRSDERAAAL